MPDWDAEKLQGGRGGAKRKSLTGRSMCAVPDCPRMSDGRRSNFMCRGHYTKLVAEERGLKAMGRGMKEKNMQEKQKKMTEELPPDDGDHTASIIGDDEQGIDDEADATKPSTSPTADAGSSSAAETVNMDNDEEDTGRRRRTRRNRKPSAKVVAAVRDEAELQERAAKRKAQKGGDRGSYYPTSSKKPKLRPHSGMIRLLAAPKRPVSTSPEPPYLFRKGPLPPPSPPIEPCSSPPDFLISESARKQPRASVSQAAGGSDMPLPSSTSSGPVRSHAQGNVPDETAGVYAPLIRLRVQRDADASAIVPLPPRIVGGLRDQIEKVKQCNCKKSNCLKLYCEVCCTNNVLCMSFLQTMGLFRFYSEYFYGKSADNLFAYMFRSSSALLPPSIAALCATAPCAKIMKIPSKMSVRDRGSLLECWSGILMHFGLVLWLCQEQLPLLPPALERRTPPTRPRHQSRPRDAIAASPSVLKSTVNASTRQFIAIQALVTAAIARTSLVMRRESSSSRRARSRPRMLLRRLRHSTLTEGSVA